MAASWLSCLLFVASVGFSPVGAADGLVVCVDSDNPPFMHQADGRAAGLYPALIAAALGAQDQAVTIEARPWKRCIAEIDEGRSGIGGVYKNDERLKKYDFSDPIFVEKMAVYFNRARPLAFQSVADLAGKRIGVIRGWSYGDVFDQAVRDGRITVQDVKSDLQNFQKLAAGRLDAILAIEEAGAGHLKAGHFAGLERSPRYLFEYPTFLAFNKGARQGPLLLKFNQALDEMKRSGKFDRMVAAELSP